MQRPTENKLNKMMGILVIGLLFLSWCFFTIAYKGLLFLVGGFICAMAALFIYMRCHRIVFVEESESFRRDLTIVDTFIIAVGLIMAVGTIRDSFAVTATEKVRITDIAGVDIDMSRQVVGAALLIWSLSVLLYRLSSTDVIYRSIKSKLKAVPGILTEHKWFVVLLIVATALCYDPDWRHYRWDGCLYYIATKRINPTSISGMSMYSHLSQFHGLIMLFFDYLIRDTQTAMYAANISLFVLGSVFFYRILRRIMPGHDEIEYVLGTAVYLFSPYYLGMVTYFSLDYTLMCLAPIVFYFLLEKRWILFSVASIFFCFTKEPAILIFGMMCLGEVLNDLLIRKKTIKDILSTIHYYYMAIIGVMWLMIFKMLGPWSGGESSVGFEANYATDKLKALYVLNFHWVIVIIVVLCIIYGLAKKWFSSDDTGWLLPIALSGVGFTVFSIFFNTVNHPRYIDIVPFILYLLMAVLIMRVKEGKKGHEVFSGSILAVIAAAMLVSCFVTADPLSKSLFRTINAGSTDIIMTSDVVGDGSVYNRQALGMESAYSMALCDAIKSGNIIISLSDSKSTYEADGMSESLVIKDGYLTLDQNMNTNTKTRTADAESGTIPYKITYITSKAQLSDLAEPGDSVSIIFPAYIDETAYGGVFDNLEKKSCKEYDYRGWKINCIEGIVR